MTQSYSLKEVRAALEPVADWQPKGMRELARRLRWEQGWQGAGPLSYRNLKRTVGGDTLRQTLRAIDNGNPPKSLRQAYERLGFPPGGGVTRLPDGPISLRSIARRIQAPETVRLKFLSYNTYLLQGLQIPLGRWIDDAVGWDALSWFGIPFGGALLTLLGLTSIPGLVVATILEAAGYTPSKVINKITGIDLNGIKIGAKPALEARSSELGSILSNYDVCCLCEVWTQDSRDRILNDLDSRMWESAAGPDESGAFILNSSGLFFLAKNRQIVKTERMIYSDRGSKNRDTDAWSNKGAMLNIIDLGFGQFELFQTHLCFGGGIKDNVRVSTPGISDPTDEDRMNVWHAELAELADFYRSHHQPQNVAIITGDFNMNGTNVREYAEIRRVMDSLGLRDLWAWDVYDHHPSEGLTCRFTDGDESNWIRNFDTQCDYLPGPQDQQYCDDRTFIPAPKTKPPQGVGRYDFLFAQNPTSAHQYNLEVSRILRRPFPRAHPSDGESYLSDHLGLDVTLYLSPR